MPWMDETKLHTWEFRLKGSSRNMRCKLLQKRFTGKTTVFQTMWNTCTILPLIDKDILSELHRCIFPISLKYIKLVIPKILYICWYYAILIFTSKLQVTPSIKSPRPHQNKNFWLSPPAKTFLKLLTQGGACSA